MSGESASPIVVLYFRLTAYTHGIMLHVGMVQASQQGIICARFPLVGPRFQYVCHSVPPCSSTKLDLPITAPHYCPR